MRRDYVRRILCLSSRVAHSLVWTLPDCHSIVALLVISGKQASSELLHTLRFICVCWPPKRQCSISTTSSPQHGSTSCLPGNFLARVTISTNVDDTASSHRSRVSQNIHNTLHPGRLAGTRRWRGWDALYVYGISQGSLFEELLRLAKHILVEFCRSLQKK